MGAEKAEFSERLDRLESVEGDDVLVGRWDGWKAFGLVLLCVHCRKKEDKNHGLFDFPRSVVSFTQQE